MSFQRAVAINTIWPIAQLYFNGGVSGRAPSSFFFISTPELAKIFIYWVLFLDQFSEANPFTTQKTK